MESVRLSNGSALAPISVFEHQDLVRLAQLARKSVFEVCLAADHGHIGGSSAAVELLVTLYFGGILRFNPRNPADSRRDRVLVRGHLGPLRYTLFAWLGWLDEQELSTYRRMGSRLHGHEDHLETPGVDISPSGSLGMLLSYGVGAAIAARDTNADFKTYVFLGDGEEQEGVVSEAARHAAHVQAGNLIAIIDCNGKQLSNPVVDTDSTNLAALWKGYGWNVISVANGHSVAQVRDAYLKAGASASSIGSPTVIIANTVKGVGLSGAEGHFSGFHTMSRVSADVVRQGAAQIESALDADEAQKLLAKVKALCAPGVVEEITSRWKPAKLDIRPSSNTPNHPDNCQADYFKELGRLADRGLLDRDSLYFLTADVTTKETVEGLGLSRLFRFYNVGIREQHMIAMAHGLSLTRPDTRILINSFDAFGYRCIDQIQAMAQGHGSVVILGDVSGITNSRNGKTHQTSGLPAALLAMDGVTFLEPWDVHDTYACLNWALGESRRIVYIRIHSSPITQSPEANVDRSLDYYPLYGIQEQPDIVLVGAGLTIDGCVEAARRLASENLHARVINVLNPNSLNKEFAQLCGADVPLVTAYNGHPRVLRQAVADALMQSGVRAGPSVSLGFLTGTTGTLPEMTMWAGLDGEGVYAAAKSVL